MGKQIIIKGADFSEVAINEVTRYAITYALTNVSAASQPSSIIAGNTLTLQLSAASGYVLPTSVGVKNTSTGTAITSGVNYNSTTGVLTVSNVSCAITVTVVGIEDDTPADTPSLTVSPATVTLKAKAGGTATATVAIGGENLTSGVSASLSSNTGLSLSASQFTAREVMSGVSITITFSPVSGATPGTTTVTLTVASNGATSKTVTLTVIVALPDDVHNYSDVNDAEDMIVGGLYARTASGHTLGEFNSSLAYWLTTDYLPVESGYTEFILEHERCYSENLGLVWFDSSKNPISGIPWTKSDAYVSQEGNVPSNAAYVRFTIANRVLAQQVGESYAILTLKDE